jgi:plasmid stabilization system protein ParE
MAAELVIAPEAAADLDEAYAWYEAQQVGRGEDFLGRIDACIRAILRFPEMHATFHQSYRRALVRKFPYAVFYEYANGVVTVYCVFHASRDPEKWRRRLP